MWNSTTYETGMLTVELRHVVNSGLDIWDFDYPSYYEGQARFDFEQKVIDHFYFRQLGAETVGRWLHNFRTRMREIMPYYIQMYKSVEIMNGIEDPFGNVDITETFKQTSSGTSSGTTEGESTGTDTSSSQSSTTSSQNTTTAKAHKFSNTPQGSISNLDSYMTEASTDNDTEGTTGTASVNASGQGSSSGTSKQTSNASEQGTIEHTFTKKGNQGVNTYTHDMIEYRKSFIDVDMMIINNLQDLFLGLY